ncbi:unannotated protein [freshwater metagenome]|uniref:Unannotated protein n=1 Tax=freshwater metagenome TaxID=449393 RepID=A0A6J6J186_9ZZZZ|nr:hypothetical protein [Actinomycetota bacterium]
MHAKKSRNLFTKFLAIILSATVAFVGLSIPAGAATVDATGVKLKFDEDATVQIIRQTNSSAGKAVNDIVVYRNVATISGLVIDAVIETLAITNGATVDKFDGGGAVADKEVFETDLDTSGAQSVTFKFSFYEGGSYTAVNTGTLVTLQNVFINSYDLDTSGGSNQFTQFSGFQSYTLSTNTTLSVSNPSGNLVQFVNNFSGANYTTTSGAYTKGRVQVKYDYLSTVTIKHGTDNAGSGGTNFYGLEFGVGFPWTEGSNTISTTSTSNNFNSPPVAGDDTLNVAPNVARELTKFDFGTYSDPDNNPWANIQITTLPSNGVLEYLSGSTWVPVTLNQIISYSDLDAGKLRYTPNSGATSDSVGFKVGDGLTSSVAAYSLAITVVPTAQQITFANPNAKAPSQTFPSGAVASSGLTVSLVSNTTGICTVSGLDITTVAVGTCSITSTQPGNSTFAAAIAVTQEFPVSTLTSQTITFNNPGSKSTGATFASGATASSGLTVTLTSLTPSICTVSGLSITTLSTAGTCQIRASQAGNGSIAPASNVNQSFLVSAPSLTSQTITFSPPADQLLSASTLTVAPTATSGLTVSLSSSTQSICTVSSFTITFVSAGNCTITASQAGDSTYSAAQNVVRTFAITVGQNNSTPSGGGSRAMSPIVGPANGTTTATIPKILHPEVIAVGIPTLCLVDSATGRCGNTVTVAGVGNWTLNPNGSVTFVALTAFFGTATVTLRASDALGAIDEEPITVIVLAPGIGGDQVDTEASKSKETNNRTAVVLDDLELGSGEICLVNLQSSLCAIAPLAVPNQGKWEILSDGSVKFTPSPRFVGVSKAQLRISSVGGKTTLIPLSVKVTKRPPVTVTIGNFIDGSPVITAAIAARIRLFMRTYSDYRTIECIGFTEGPTVLSTDRWLSRQRAVNACNYVTKNLKQKLFVSGFRSSQERSVASSVRRVTITLRD